MFIFLYRFKVKPGEEQSFQENWRHVTKMIIKERGGLGSRLHRSQDGTFMAYAQWPSKEAAAKKIETSSEYKKTQQAMLACVEASEVVFELDVLDDLLVLASAPQ